MKPKRRLPEGWRWEKIEPHILGYQSGLARGDKSKKDGYPHLRMNNISNGGKLDLSLLWRIPATEQEVRAYAVRKGDILFNNTNSPELVGKSCLFNLDSTEVFLFSNHITRLRTKSTLYPRYLLYWINALWRKKYFQNNCDVWVNQAALRVEERLFPLRIPLPPTFDNQAAIADQLEREMAEVEEMRQAALRQKEAVSAMQGAILRETFPWKKDDKLPEGWRWERLGRISNRIQYGLSRESSRVRVGPKLLRITDIQNGRVDWSNVPFCQCTSEEKKEYLLADGDIVFTRTGATTGKSLLIKNPDRSLFASYLIRVKCEKEQILPDYLYCFFQSPIYWSDISRGARGGTLAGFNASMLSSIRVPLPPNVGDQKNIVEKIKRDMIEIEKVRQPANRQFEAIEALPGAILREAFDFEEEG